MEKGLDEDHDHDTRLEVDVAVIGENSLAVLYPARHMHSLAA